MKVSDRRQHWETIYQTKEDNEVSWYQDNPAASMQFFNKYAVSKDAKIIDVGGGNSRLVEYLLKAGYEDLTVLDISETALNKAKEKLSKQADKVKWIVANITTFQPDEQYDVWHDRAVFHFLTLPEKIDTYIRLAESFIAPGGYLMIATFSDKGPEKCSGLTVSRYSPEALEKKFAGNFCKVECMEIHHQTPFDTVQDFTYCCFKRKACSGCVIK